MVAWLWGGEYERSGRLSSAVRHEAARLAYAPSSQCGGVFAPSSVGAAAGALQHTRTPRHVSCVQFDAEGHLLACALSTGGVQVLNFPELRAELPFAEGVRLASSLLRAPLTLCGAGVTVQTAAPVLCLEGERLAEALRWSPTSQDVLATASPADADLHLFDLGVCDEDTPSTTLVGDPQSARLAGVARSGAGGLSDFSFFGGDSRSLLACGFGGKLLLWDTRSAHRPRAVVAAPRSCGQLRSLQLASDDQVVYVAGEAGDILCWDLRGGRNTSVFSAPNQVTYPLLHTLSVSALLLEVPSLAEEVDVESSAVQSLLFDPADSRRLAFHLACGWSGVIDLSAMAVTHVHCPPPPWLANDEPHTAAQHALWAIKHRPAWVQSATFLAGPPTAPLLRVLDFELTPASGCYVNGEPCLRCSASEHCRRCARPIELRTLAPVVAVAAHPLSEDIVVGLQGGNMQVLTHGACGGQAESSEAGA